MSKKICHLTTVHPRYDTRIFHKECVSLSKAGYEVYLVVADGKGDEQINGIKILDIGKPKNRKHRVLNFSKKAYKKILQLDCDLVHFHDPELIPIGLKLKKLGKKVIYDIHENIPEQIMYKHYIPKPFKPLLSEFIDKWESRAIKKFSYNIVADPNTHNRIKTKTSNVEIVKNFVILDKIEIDWDKKQNLMTYIGSITEARGIWELMDVLNYVDIKLVLAGKFGSEDLEKSVKSHGQWSKVDYHGFIGKQEIIEILKNVKIGLVPLHKTKKYLGAYPVKLFEYMNAGIPVIINKIPLWEEIVLKENCGLSVDITNKKEFAKAINFLLENPEQARKMGENGKKAVLEKYNWDTEKKKLLKVYQKILKH